MQRLLSLSFALFPLLAQAHGGCAGSVDADYLCRSDTQELKISTIGQEIFILQPHVAGGEYGTTGESRNGMVELVSSTLLHPRHGDETLWVSQEVLCATEGRGELSWRQDRFHCERKR